MKLPEEESDSELRKRLQAKFEGFHSPVKDDVRTKVFAAVPGSPAIHYWGTRIGIPLLILAIFVCGVWYDQKFASQVYHTVLGKSESTNRSVGSHARDTAKTYSRKTDAGLKPPVSPAAQAETARQPLGKKSANQKVTDQKDSNIGSLTRTGNSPARKDRTESAVATAAPLKKPGLPVGDRVTVAARETTANPENAAMPSVISASLLPPIDSLYMSIPPGMTTLPSVAKSIAAESAKKRTVHFGLKGVFSVTALQTFQLVNLSQAGSDRIQNFRFAPLLSSRSLSYKLTGGVERKHTQLHLSYTYFRNWNEFETGTNQVTATRIGQNQYSMLRIGEMHVEDDRSHLIGVGLRQNLPVPQHILKNYAANAGVEYTREVSKAQNFLWGTLGFYKQLHQSDGSRIDIGPYVQYSFLERKVEGQAWKYRPYQVGISVGVRLK